jgi:hypothetical protein
VQLLKITMYKKNENQFVKICCYDSELDNTKTFKVNLELLCNKYSHWKKIIEAKPKELYNTEENFKYVQYLFEHLSDIESKETFTVNEKIKIYNLIRKWGGKTDFTESKLSFDFVPFREFGSGLFNFILPIELRRNNPFLYFKNIISYLHEQIYNGLIFIPDKNKLNSENRYSKNLGSEKKQSKYFCKNLKQVFDEENIEFVEDLVAVLSIILNLNIQEPKDSYRKDNYKSRLLEFPLIPEKKIYLMEREEKQPPPNFAYPVYNGFFYPCIDNTQIKISLGSLVVGFDFFVDWSLSGISKTTKDTVEYRNSLFEKITAIGSFLESMFNPFHNFTGYVFTSSPDQKGDNYKDDNIVYKTYVEWVKRLNEQRNISVLYCDDEKTDEIENEPVTLETNWEEEYQELRKKYEAQMAIIKKYSFLLQNISEDNIFD